MRSSNRYNILCPINGIFIDSRMFKGTLKKTLLFVIVFIIGIGIFLFGSPHLDDFLNEKKDILNTISIKLQIVESIQSSDQPEMRQTADVTMRKYSVMKQDLCKKRYFYLKSECELRELNKSSLNSLNSLLETGIQEIVAVQNSLQELRTE